jgi:hypothetical protein
MSASAGSGDWRPHIEGVDQAFSYEWSEESETGQAFLHLTRLAAQIRHDLEQRKSTDPRQEIPLIVGQKIPRNVLLAPQVLRNGKRDAGTRLPRLDLPAEDQLDEDLFL